MIKIIQSIAEWKAQLKELTESKKSIGFVPTMGALHQGHLSLVKRASEENDVCVLSIFVNPTQFNNQEDLEKYPRTLERDLELLKTTNAQFVFLPTKEILYPDNYRFQVKETEFSQKLCGAHRPGHFDGVLSVVLKLLQIIKPNKAYFGQKDYQQLQLIKDMCEAFFLDVTVVECPIIRESTGLAMSSRNERLSEAGKQKAATIFELLRQSISKEEFSLRLSNAGFQVDYVEDIESRRFVAASIENVRLIDNQELL